jgi:hypothetical protein
MQVKRLSFQDIFIIGRIIQKAGAEATEGIVNAQGSELAAGLAIAMSFPAAEPEVYRLIASVTGKDAETVKEMDSVEVMAIIETVIDQEDLEAVFQSARRLLGKVKDKMPKSLISSAAATDTAPEKCEATVPQ